MNALTRTGLAFLFLNQLSLGVFAQSGIITTYVGPGLPVNGAQATAQAIDEPEGVAPDGAGGFYISSTSQNRIYRVAADGSLRIVAGSGTNGFSGDGGPAVAAQLYAPHGVAVDSAGNLYIADTGNFRIRKVTPGGVISTAAGNGSRGFGGDGGPASAAKLDRPYDVAVDSVGNVYIADRGNFRIRKVTAAGVISTVAGGGPGGLGDGGPATAAQLSFPSGVEADSASNLTSHSRNDSLRRTQAASHGKTGEFVGPNLDGDLAVEVGVFSAVDLAHAARTKLLGDGVVTEVWVIMRNLPSNRSA